MKRFKDYQGDPVGFLKRLDEIDIDLAMHLTDGKLGDMEDYTQWENGYVQGQVIKDIVAEKGTFETIWRRSKYSPFLYMGQCYAGSLKNENPALGRRIYVCSEYRNGDPRSIARNAENTRKECLNIIRDGDIPVCPQLYYTQFLSECIPEQQAFMQQSGLEDLRKCDAMIVLIHNNRLSENAEGEIIVAGAELGIPVNIKHMDGPEKR